MTRELYNAPFAERFEHLYKLISSERFLKMQGLGNEVPFFICPYDPGEAQRMQEMVGQLVNRLANQGTVVLEVNLYDVAIALLRQRGIWERILQMEPTISRGQLKELLQGVLDPESHLVPAIAKEMEARPFDVLFLTGVGEVFPYIRSHNVLNNLQSTAKERPTVIFFPGRYVHSPETGASLDLFGRLHDDKYYRAFNIYQVEA